MGANAVTKLRHVIQNVQRVLAIELLTAAQALDLRRPYKSSPALEHIRSTFRKEVSFMPEDVVLHDKLMAAEQFLNNNPDEMIKPFC
jgi:histidine ammonia-lyase